jgi:single-strand DNA-binding protein
MSGLNKAMIIGNIGFVEKKDKFVKISIATSEKFTGQDGSKNEKTTWHNVVFFSKLADIARQYLTKGMKVYVEGKIDNQTYEKDGIKHYSTSIIANSMQMLGSKSEGNATSGDNPPPKPSGQPTTDEYADYEDNIPF